MCPGIAKTAEPGRTLCRSHNGFVFILLDVHGRRLGRRRYWLRLRWSGGQGGVQIGIKLLQQVELLHVGIDCRSNVVLMVHLERDYRLLRNKSVE